MCDIMYASVPNKTAQNTIVRCWLPFAYATLFNWHRKKMELSGKPGLHSGWAPTLIAVETLNNVTVSKEKPWIKNNQSPLPLRARRRPGTCRARTGPTWASLHRSQVRGLGLNQDCPKMENCSIDQLLTSSRQLESNKIATCFSQS